MPPDQPPPPPKQSAADCRTRQADKLATIRLRMAIWRYLDESEITTTAEIGVALRMPADDANKLMNGRQWREGDVARLETVAVRLGIDVSGQ